MTDTLLARLEAATEGSRELDAAIYQEFSAGNPDWLLFSDDPGYDFDPEIHDPHRGTGRPRHFTTSLDAARALLPKWANCHGYDVDPTGCTAFMSRNHVAKGHQLFEGVAATPALALCIAALKARS